MNRHQLSLFSDIVPEGFQTIELSSMVPFKSNAVLSFLVFILSMEGRGESPYHECFVQHVHRA